MSKKYYLVRRNHWQANSYIFEVLCSAEDKVAKLKKEYPRDNVLITELVELESQSLTIRKLQAEVEVLREQRDKLMTADNYCFKSGQKQKAIVQLDAEVAAVVKEIK